MRRLLTGAFLAAGIAAALACAPDRSSWGPSKEVERAFAAGGRITMDLAAGAYTITGSADERIHVQWRARSAGGDLDAATVRLDITGEQAHLTTASPRQVRELRATIGIPRRSDVTLRLSAGELSLGDVEGHLDVSAWAGELRIDIGTPERYRRVDASVTAGEIRAEPFDATTGGLFRSFTWDGNGPYTLRARLRAGELTLAGSTPGTLRATDPEPRDAR